LKIGYNKRYGWKTPNSSFLSALHRFFLKIPMSPTFLLVVPNYVFLEATIF